MAQRIPKLFFDLLDVDELQPFAVLGIYAGPTPPDGMKTYSEWVSSKTGYWAYIQVAATTVASLSVARASGYVSALDASVAGYIQAVLASGNTTGTSSPLTATAVRYIQAVFAIANSPGSISPLIAAVNSADTVSAALGTALSGGSVSALTATFIRFVQTSLAYGSANGTENPLSAAFIRYMSGQFSNASAGGSISPLSALDIYDYFGSGWEGWTPSSEYNGGNGSDATFWITANAPANNGTTHAWTGGNGWYDDSGESYPLGIYIYKGGDGNGVTVGSGNITLKYYALAGYGDAVISASIDGVVLGSYTHLTEGSWQTLNIPVGANSGSNKRVEIHILPTGLYIDDIVIP